jgi:hypothetical protein
MSEDTMFNPDDFKIDPDAKLRVTKFRINAKTGERERIVTEQSLNEFMVEPDQPWHPISTAPKDREIIVRGDNGGMANQGAHILPAYWEDELDGFVPSNEAPEFTLKLAFITHWREKTPEDDVTHD